MKEQGLIDALIYQDCIDECERIGKMTGEQIADAYAHRITSDTYAYIDNGGHLSFVEKSDRFASPADEWQSVGYLEKMK